MTFMPWKDAYLTGIPQVDEEHRAIFALLDRLHRSIEDGSARVVGGEILAELTAYAEQHFALEEGMMQAVDYAGLADHRRQHHEARSAIHQFRNDHLDGRKVLGRDVAEFLKDWLDRHILGTDLQYVPFVRK